MIGIEKPEIFWTNEIANTSFSKYPTINLLFITNRRREKKIVIIDFIYYYKYYKKYLYNIINVKQYYRIRNNRINLFNIVK